MTSFWTTNPQPPGEGRHHLVRKMRDGRKVLHAEEGSTVFAMTETRPGSDVFDFPHSVESEIDGERVWEFDTVARARVKLLEFINYRQPRRADPRGIGVDPPWWNISLHGIHISKGERR